MTLICRNLILWSNSASWLSSFRLLDILRWELRQFLAITVRWLSWYRIALRSSLLLTLSSFIACLLNLFHSRTAASWMWLSWIRTIALTLQQQILLSLTLNDTILRTLWMWYWLSTLWNHIIVINCVFDGVFVRDWDLRRCINVLLGDVGHCKTLLITWSRPLIILILIQNNLLMALFGQYDIFFVAF